ncbi:MAG: hypothetical protein ACREO5_06170 [Candidatus Binatia bacterium]
MNETELIDNEIIPMRRRTTWKDWLQAIGIFIVFGIALYVGILFAAADYAPH